MKVETHNTRLRGWAALGAITVAALLGATACVPGDGDSGTGTSEAHLEDTGPQGDAAWEELVSAAQGEGEVTIYSSTSNKVLEELARRFDHAYGITVHLVRDNDNILHQKLDAEARTNTPTADVVAQYTPAWNDERSVEGYFVPPTGPAFRDGDYPAGELVSAGGSFVPSAAVMTFGWNTDLYPDKLTSYADLLDPALSDGKIGVVGPVSGAITDYYGYLDKNYGSDFVTNLAAQRPRIYPSAQAIQQALLSGEIVAGAFIQDQSSENEDGAPVATAFADEIWGTPIYAGVLAKAPHPNAAQLLANFMVTPAGQEALAWKGASSIGDIESSATTLDRVAEQDPHALTSEATEAFRQRFEQLFGS